MYQDVLGGVLNTPGLVHFLEASLTAFSLSLAAGSRPYLSLRRLPLVCSGCFTFTMRLYLRLYQDVSGWVLDTPGLVYFLDSALTDFSLSLAAGSRPYLILRRLLLICTGYFTFTIRLYQDVLAVVPGCCRRSIGHTRSGPLPHRLLPLACRRFPPLPDPPPFTTRLYRVFYFHYAVVPGCCRRGVGHTRSGPRRSPPSPSRSPQVPAPT